MNKDFPLNRFNFTNLIEHIRTEILIPNVITDDETGIEFYGGDSIPQKALICSLSLPMCLAITFSSVWRDGKTEKFFSVTMTGQSDISNLRMTSVLLFRNAKAKSWGAAIRLKIGLR